MSRFRHEWTDEQLLTAPHLIDNVGLTHLRAAEEMTRMFRHRFTKGALIGATSRIRAEDALVPDTCARPQNMDGGMSPCWWNEGIDYRVAA